MLVSYFNFESSILIIKRILTFSSERGYEIAFYTNCVVIFFQYMSGVASTRGGGGARGGGGVGGGGGIQKITKKKQ